MTAQKDEQLLPKGEKKGGNLTNQMLDTYTTGVEHHHQEDGELENKTISKPPVEETKEMNEIPDVIVAATMGKSSELPNPNKQGTVGSVPLEKLNLKNVKGVPKRDINKYDTSISGPGILDDLSPRDKEKLESLVTNDSVDNLYPWKKIMGFSSSGKGFIDNTNATLTKTYILENFYNDWYSNVVLMVGTCFFAWLFAYMGLSWWSLGLVFFGTASVYNTEYRRFNRNIRDDLKRITVDETMSGRVETTLWLNSFLSKFWVIYMPVLSKQVKDIVNPILADVVPGYGIDALTLEEFTLGTKAPAIKGIKSYTKGGKDVVEMDWSFEFTPNDVSDMTPIEARNKINPKISLGVTLGKSFVSKTLSVLVEDMNVAGRIRVKLIFGKVFPNIKIVSVQLLEPPMIDFVLKPLGGDTLGIDVMSFLPGLKTFVKKIIDSIASPMIYAPNHMDINVEEIMAAQANDAIGVLAVTISSASNLVGSDFITNTVDPYMILKTDKSLPGENNEWRTNIKSDIRNPVWNETKYILINSLDQKLTMSCFDFNDVRKDQLIGNIEFDMTTLYQTPVIDKRSDDLFIGSKPKGTLNYSIQYFPVVERKQNQSGKEGNNDDEQESIINNDEEYEESQEEDYDAGILKFTLQRIQNLPTVSQISNSLSPSAELYLDSKLIKSYRRLKRINEPSWNEVNEFLVPSKENSKLTIKVFDNRSSGKTLLCSYTSDVDDIVNAMEAGQESVKASPQGEIFIMTQWKPIELTGVAKTLSSTNTPMGSLKINVGPALIKSSLSGIGDIDPYFTILLNKHLRYKSPHFSDTMKPEFDSSIYVPITSENQVLTIALADYQSVGSDRRIGSIQFPISRIIDKKKDDKGYICRSEFRGDLQTFKLVGKNNVQSENTVQLGFEFVNTMQVYSGDELKEVELLEEELKGKKEKFEKEQEEYKIQMDSNPDDWHIVEIKDPFEDDERKINAKERLTFDELISHNSGILSISIVNGKIPVSCFLQILVDSIPCPEFVSSKYGGRTPLSANVNVMVRDLKHSKLLFRITSSKNAKDRDDLVTEKYLSTIDLLTKGFANPTKIELNGSLLDVSFNYYPSYEEMPLEETVMDTGLMSLKLIGATNLMAADRNGKSDPFAYVYVDGCKVHKTSIVKKSLNPVWNETVSLKIISKCRNKVIIKVLDWDRAGDNDFLGEVMIDLNEIEPEVTQEWELSLNTQGSVKCETRFVPQYIKPDIEFKEKALGDTVPMKAIGAGANVAGNVVAGTAGVATGVVGGVASTGLKAGGHIFKTIGANKILPSRKSIDKSTTHEGSPNDTTLNNEEEQEEEETRNNDDVQYIKRTVTQDTGKTQIDDNDTHPHSKHKLSMGRLSMSSDRSNGGGESHGNRRKSMGSSIHHKFAIPSFGNKDSSHSVNSRSSSTLTSGRGKVSVLATSNLGKNVCVRVTLIKDGQREEIFKTNVGKSDSNGSCYYQAQSAHFGSSSEGVIEFEAITSHRLTKDKSLGVAKVSLVNPEIRGNEKAAVDIGPGRVIFQIQYVQ